AAHLGCAIPRAVVDDQHLEPARLQSLVGQGRQQALQAGAAVVGGDDDADTRLHGQNVRTTLAGTPATMERGGTSLVTTLPAATTEAWPMVTPLRTVDRVPH